MPSRSERADKAEQQPGEDASDQQQQTAAELSDRAAESVDRGYDATKEIHLGDRARRRAGGEPFEDREEQEGRQDREIETHRGR